MTARRRLRLTAARGFGLVESIAVIVILGVLATIAVISFDGVAERAARSSTEGQMRTTATAVLSRQALDRTTSISRAQVLTALRSVLAAPVADGQGAGWVTLSPDVASDRDKALSLGFSNGDGVANPSGGRQVIVATATGAGTTAVLITAKAPDASSLAGASQVCFFDGEHLSATELFARTGTGSLCSS